MPNIANLPSSLGELWIKLQLTRISWDGWIARRSRKSNSRKTIVKAIPSFVFSLLDTWLFSESLILRRWRNGTRESIIFSLTFQDSHMRACNENCSLPERFTIRSPRLVYNVIHFFRNESIRHENQFEIHQRDDKIGWFDEDKELYIIHTYVRQSNKCFI